MKRLDTEQKGFALALVEIVLAGLFPVVTKYGVGFINPLFFAAVSALLGAGFMFIVLRLRGELRLVFSRELLPSLFLIGLFGTFFSSIFFFYGSTLTSGVNASILLQSEPVYSLFLSFFLLRELITRKQVGVTLLILSGTIIVLYNGALSINIGDILVILTPLFWQLGHVLARKTLEKASSYVVTTSRVLYGGLLLALLTLVSGLGEYQFLSDPGIMLMFLFQGIIVYVGSMIVWYEAIGRINLSKATAIIAPYPVFSVILAWMFLGETVSVYQIAGLAVILVGLVLLSKIRSEKREKENKKQVERMREKSENERN